MSRRKSEPEASENEATELELSDTTIDEIVRRLEARMFLFYLCVCVFFLQRCNHILS